MSSGVRSIVVFLTGIILFIGLPLLGWGLDDIQGFTVSPARLGYIAVVILLQIFVAIRFPDAGRNQGNGKKPVQRQRWAVVMLHAFHRNYRRRAVYGSPRDCCIGRE